MRAVNMIWLGLCLLTLCNFCNGDQDTINYLGSNTHLQYNVLDNLADPSNFFGQLLLTNTGPSDITDQAWSLYFCSIGLFEPDSIEPNGAILGNTSLMVSKVTGCLHRIDPLPTFPGFPAGQTVDVPFEARGNHIIAAWTMLNWYFANDGDEPRVITNTAVEDYSWVGEFSTENQWKRSPSDTYNPYTGPQRYTNYNYEDLDMAPTPVIPTPLEDNLDPATSVNIGTGDWVVVTGDPSLSSEAEFLASALGTVAVDPLQAPDSNYIQVNISEVRDTDGDLVTESEAHRLNVLVSSQIISIDGTDASGVFYGVQSLLSMNDASPEIPSGFLVDYPRFHYRGMHLDVGRNFYDKTDILRLLDVMATYKLNKFHFHLSDDEGWRLEIPGFPELTEVGARRCHDTTETNCLLPQLGSAPIGSTVGSGHYTVSDYKQILAYANTRHIQVIPELDMPGHCYAAIKASAKRYDRYVDSNVTAALEFLLWDQDDQSDYTSAQGYSNNSINPCLDSTYNFVSLLVRELKDMHSTIQPLTVFNYGGDEVPVGAWTSSPACSNISSSTEILFAYFKREVAEIVDSEGLNLAGWGDGFMKATEPYDKDAFLTDEVYAYVWQTIFEWGSGSRPYDLANAGYKTILSPATHFYFDMAQEPDPYDRAHYWATRLSNNVKVFSYIPDNIYENMGVDGNGNPIDKEQNCAIFGCPPLEVGNEANIIGVQGQLWTEFVRNSSNLQQMIFPRLLTLSERAWHKAAWESLEDGPLRDAQQLADFERFTNTMGHKELARLEDRQIHFNINPPGAQIVAGNELQAKAEFPGSPIVYSTDGGQTWSDYKDGLIMSPGTVQVVTRSPNGSRSSRVVELEVS